MSLVIDGNGYRWTGRRRRPRRVFDGMQPFAIESGSVVSMEDLTVTGGSRSAAARSENAAAASATTAP